MVMKRHENNIQSPIRAVMTYTGDNCGTLGPRFAVQAQNYLMEEIAQDQLAKFLNKATGRDGSEREISEELEKAIVNDFNSVLSEEKDIYIYKGCKSIDPDEAQRLAVEQVIKEEYESTPKKIVKFNNKLVVDEKRQTWPIGITPMRISLSAEKLSNAQIIEIESSSKKETEMAFSHDFSPFTLLITCLYCYLLNHKNSLEQNKLNEAVCSAAREFTLLPHIKYKDSIYGRDNANGTMPALFENRGLYSFQSRKGVKPSDAIKSIFHKEQKSLILDCSTGLQIIHYKALLDFLGEEKFNKIFSQTGIRIEQCISNKNPTVCIRDELNSDWRTIVESPEDMLGKITPGDLVYISNIKPYAKRHPAGETPGFNVIYLGKNEKGQHEFGGLFTEKRVHTYDEIIDLMIKDYNKVPYHMQSKTDSQYAEEKQPNTTFEGTLVKALEKIAVGYDL